MLKIACYGYIKKDGGSVTGANFLILQELLNRGVQIDFFGWKNFNYPVELVGHENFRFIELPDKAFLRKSLKRFLPQKFHSLFDRTLGGLIQNLYSEKRNQQILHDAIATEHEQQPYDLLVFLSLYAPFRVFDIPVVSWTQGTPNAEWFYIQRLREKIIQYCGLLTYLQFKFFYWLKNPRVKASLKNTDVFICESEWSREQMLACGLQPNVLKVLPYPIDLEVFQPGTQPKAVDRKKTFLWLGRIAPRKRLDLLIEAYTLLLEERQDVHLKIIGGFKHVKGYKKLVDEFEQPEFIEYRESIDRQLIPDLIRACDVVIQTSEGENFGSAVAEGLGCGVPAVVGPTNGTRGFASPGCCFVFEEYTPESVKQTMLEVLDNLEETSTEIALEARKIAEKNFAIAHVVDELQAVFQDTVARFSNQGSACVASASEATHALLKASGSP